MGSTLRRLVNNLGSVVMALALSFVVWIAATLQADPFDSAQVSNVPITILNQPDNTVFYEPISERVAVRVRAPESVLADLSISDFEAVMDLAGVETGEPAIVPVQVATQVEGVRIESWNPEEQRVHLEEVRTLLWPVAIEAEGEVATGYETTTTVILPNRVQLTGPESLLEQVAAVSGPIDVEGATDDIVEEVVVRPLDDQGRLVPGLQWAPDRVTVRIGVRSKVGYKPDVEVVPNLNVLPAEGYRLGNLEVDPPLVTLEGPPDLLDLMPGFIETLPISYSNVTGSLAHQTALTVPNGVVVVGVNFVTVTVEVLPILSSTTVTSPVEILGVRQGWEATVSPSLVDVSLEGPQLLLDGLRPEDIQVLVNVAQYPLGVHRVVPDVLAPEGVTVVNVIPETVEVVLALEPPPTPTVTVTPTLTITPTGTVEP